ncbi:MAG: SH3 domain-containing protein [Thermodesulfobacteriota bacterium]
MIIHAFVVALMIAVVAAFLILWYFWVKRRLDGAVLVQDQERILVPFRYFSWVFMGVLLAVCLIQIHFVRVSATVHERLASMAHTLKDKQGAREEAEEVKKLVLDLRKDMESGFARMLTWKLAQEAQVKSAEICAAETRPQTASLRKGKPVAALSSPRRRPALANGFANEARAASSRPRLSASTAQPGSTSSEGPAHTPKAKTYSMRLDLTGRVTTTSLSVRNQPEPDGLIVERLVSGEQVKVTEKRLMGQEMWYRVITPLGRAGWVDHKHLRLELASAS